MSPGGTIWLWTSRTSGGAVEAAKKINTTNALVEFVVHNGGHQYPDDAPAKIVAFFKQHRRQ
jgi:hypothetical protein